MMRVGVTGGIGSGKSTVCRLFALRGVAVYDSDAAAKRLMSGPLRERIIERFGAAVYRDGVLDRAALAAVVFSDPAALADLNALVHPAVQDDFTLWTGRQEGTYVLLESAILFESGFDRAVDRTLAVLAPADVRVMRTCRRDGISAAQVRQRMAAQLGDDELAVRADYTLFNDREEDLAPAVEALDRKFRDDATLY